jgi:hypothetical protein
MNADHVAYGCRQAPGREFMSFSQKGRKLRTQVRAIAVAACVLCTGFENPFGADLARSFELIALQNEYGDRHWMPVRKWVTPVLIFLDSRAGLKDIQLELVSAHVARLRQVTGHEIELTDDRGMANVVVVFEREALLRALVDELLPGKNFTDEFLNSSICFANFNVNRRHEIRNAVVIIPTDRARAYAKLPACVVEELTQILGLINDSEEVYPSIFNDASIDDELSEHDINLLKILYNPRIRPGMTRSEVMPIVRELAAEFQR